MGIRARRPAIVAALVACLTVALAADAGAYRSPQGARPSVKVLTKDQRAALSKKRIVVRVSVRTRARVRLRMLGLDLARRPGFIASQRTIRFSRAGTKKVSLKLTKSARRRMDAARKACRDVRVTAFASARRVGRRDSPRTTLVRHSRTLRHRQSGCVPGAGSLPGLGGPPLGGAGAAPPVPTGPISIRAGAGQGDSTPPVGSPMFAYTARSHVFGPSPTDPLQVIADPDENAYAKTFAPSQGIHTRILSRAIVIEAGGRKYALAQVDLGGHPYSLTREVLRRIENTGITGDRLLLSSTHTHSSSGAIWSDDNPGYAYLGGDAYDQRVFEQVVSGVVDAIRTANQRLQPARLGVGTAEVRNASSNRNFEPFTRNPETPENEAAARAVSIDPRVTVVRVDDPLGRPLGTWSNFAVHPTSFGDENLLFSGDNPATTERLVEEEIARESAAQGRAPPIRPVNVWTNASEGDISPRGESERDSSESGARASLDYADSDFARANNTGRRVAAGVLAAWRDAGFAMSGTPEVGSRHMFMDLDGTPAEGEPVGPQPVLGSGGIVAPDDFCAPIEHMAGPGQGYKFPLFTGPDIVPNVHPVSLFRVGPLAVAAFPSEITKQMGVRIRNAVQAEAGGAVPEGAVIAGLTNSYNSYTATPEEYDHCRYEGSFTLWGRQQGSRYRDLASALAQSLFGGAPPPAQGGEPPPPESESPAPPSIRPTPLAGTVVGQPEEEVARFGQAIFRWNGGDPSIDAPRGRALVTLEREVGGRFEAVATEDSVLDTTRHHNDDSWTETWQFSACDAPGTYRFHVRGVARRQGTDPEPYEVTSRPFELRPSRNIVAYSKTQSGNTVRVRAEYTGIPAEPIVVLPRRVRTGFAVLRVRRPDGQVTEEIALPDPNGLEFTARVPEGSAVDVTAVEDGCGNTSG